jgi:predicted Zn-dependent protease with MMP-like domain
MAIPRVFVASTCYDLKYIRGNLQYFIRSLGYEPVLSEAGDVYYDPAKHTHDSCISEVSTCQLFVLIIGGRFGGAYKQSEKSITNAEYEQALAYRVPVFTLVEQAVYAEHHVYLKNKDNTKIDPKTIVYPAVDSTKIFDFIDEVRKASFNNAIQPFQDIADIESYLRKQWAGLVFSFLARQAEEDRVADIVSHIARVSEKIEFLSQQILKSVGTEESKVVAALYDTMLGHESTRVLLGTGHKPSPIHILKYETLDDCAKAIGKPLYEKKDDTMSWSSTGAVNTTYFPAYREDYRKMRAELLADVKRYRMRPEDLITSQAG